MSQYKTTLRAIREHIPCSRGWVKLLRGLHKGSADDEPLDIARIYEINGRDYARSRSRTTTPRAGWPVT